MSYKLFWSIMIVLGTIASADLLFADWTALWERILIVIAVESFVLFVAVPCLYDEG